MKLRSGKNENDNLNSNLQKENQKNLKLKKAKNPKRKNQILLNKVATVPTKSDRAQYFLKQLFENLDSKVAYTRAIKRFIEQNEIFSKYKPARKIFKRRKTIVKGPFTTYQLDLSDMRKFGRENNNYNWMLFIIDCFSRFLYVLPMKKKDEDTTCRAIEMFLNNLPHFPEYFYHDSGTEFTNTCVKKLLSDRGILQFVLKNGPKAAIVERVQRTIKTNLEMIFAKQKNHRWIDVIDTLVSNYNNRYHRSIGMSPIEVSYSNYREVYKRMYPRIVTSVDCKLQKGDYVRILINKNLFSKGYHQNFSDEVFVIHSVIKSRNICYYIVTDLFGKNKQKKYYHQLSLVLKNVDNSSKTDNISKRRRTLSD